MGQDNRAGLGFAALLAGLAFAAVVISGLFLIRDSSGGAPVATPLDWTLPVPPSAAVARETRTRTDHGHEKPQRIARMQRLHHKARA